MHLQLADALQAGLAGNHHVPDCHTDITQYGGVAEIPLPAGDSQLPAQMTEQRVGDAQVALGILEIDRVHFVRHGGGADFTGNRFLLEVAQGDVAPHVPVEVQQHGVEPGDGVERLRHVVVGFDLDGVGVPGQAQAGVRLPVDGITHGFNHLVILRRSVLRKDRERACRVNPGQKHKGRCQKSYP